MNNNETLCGCECTCPIECPYGKHCATAHPNDTTEGCKP